MKTALINIRNMDASLVSQSPSQDVLTRGIDDNFEGTVTAYADFEDGPAGERFSFPEAGSILITTFFGLGVLVSA